MPKRKDIKKILVIGAGPIIIGQACEFDYSGTQACKALKDEGYKVVLVNSNPATIMTDPEVADQTYIEPISIEVLEEIIKKEKPNAILPTMGGQTALNLALKAEKNGLLKKYKIELIGANSKAIANAEDRKRFRKNMSDIGIDLPKSEILNNFKNASKCLKKIGLPISKWLFQLLIALRFIPLVQEEFQNIIKSVSVRSINFRNLGLKKSFNVLLILVERLFQNIFLRIDHGAESLLSKKKIIIKTNRFTTLYPSKFLNVIVNTLSICFICIAIFLRKLYGAL